MRPLFLLLPLSLLLASGAQSQNLPYPPSDDESMQTVQVTAPPRSIRVRDDEARQIAGVYEMSNGWRLNVLTSTRYIDAAIDRQKPIRLVPVAPYKFASRDGNVTMHFNQGHWGEDMTMSYVPAPRMARIVISSAPLAQR